MLFTICDRNKNGVIDREEYRQVTKTVYSLFPPKGRMHWEWREMDKDKDGKISLSEWLSGTEAIADFAGEEAFLTAPFYVFSNSELGRNFVLNPTFL